MDHVSPPEMMAEALELAKRKSALRLRDLLLRSILAGVFLSYAASMTMVIQTQGVPPIVGAALFPAGFVMLVFLGLELVTGNFALLPPALWSRQVSGGKLMRNFEDNNRQIKLAWNGCSGDRSGSRPCRGMNSLDHTL